MNERADAPTVAVFRPDDERLADAVALLADLGAEPVPDPMLAVEATDATPRTDADYVVFTSKTGAELVSAAGWEPADETVCAIGPATADALREEGYAVDIVPEAYTSSGLVDTLAGSAEPRSAERASGDEPRAEVDGARVEVARSDHGSPVLLDGLADAGAYVHETILYRLVRPEWSGESTERAAAGDLDAACFTSSLTVEHFLEAATERGVRDAALEGLADATVGVIGDPTAETAAELGVDVDVVPSEATFDALARETLAALDRRLE
ncbi:uroporphyrinogen-III synthase [Haloterrigena alkaliphila]|uniref:Uroporphyrinogen-III synthase n=1 Tax=Haloterrigena alkaliphila TaxID=2816475 RepID=A0A8A2VJP8_9EURY|nr:uroporphyrinogen-III synthase [Haloterrigena alkaliphila]QSX00553.1 uroporphyrinogen-III synthase [Haloterrigena alkaliphila]